MLAQDQLPGTVLTLGDGSGAQRRIRIDAVEHDARDPRGEVMLYTLSEPDPATGELHNACQPDPDGRRLGFPLPGAFTPDGSYVAAPGRILITCTGGAEGKCVRFGYQPWRTLPDGTSLEPYYQACVRMVRADYGGDGIGHTRNGTPIDLFDRIGIQRDEIGPGMTLEAAFAPDGAVCVAHPRLSDLTSLDILARQYPRLAGHLGADCDKARQRCCPSVPSLAEQASARRATARRRNVRARYNAVQALPEGGASRRAWAKRRNNRRDGRDVACSGFWASPRARRCAPRLPSRGFRGQNSSKARPQLPAPATGPCYRPVLPIEPAWSGRYSSNMGCRAAVLAQIARRTTASLERTGRRVDMHAAEPRAGRRSDYRWLLCVTAGRGFGALLGAMAHGFHWL